MSKQLTLQLTATAKDIGKPELLSCKTTLLIYILDINAMLNFSQ